MTERATPVLTIPHWLMNLTIALLLLGLAAWLWIGAADIDDTGGAVNAADFPRAIALLLGFSSLMVIARIGAMARSGRHGEAVRVQRPVPVAGAILMVAAYPLLISYAGYYIATALWLAPFVVVCGMRNVVGVFATTAGFLLFTKVLFQMVLGTPLP